MPLTITLPPKVESRLLAAAAAEGTDAEKMAAQVLAEWSVTLPTDEETGSGGVVPIEEDPEALSEILTAFDEAQEAEARGERHPNVGESFQRTMATLGLTGDAAEP